MTVNEKNTHTHQHSFNLNSISDKQTNKIVKELLVVVQSLYIDLIKIVCVCVFFSPNGSNTEINDHAKYFSLY